MSKGYMGDDGNLVRKRTLLTLVLIAVLLMLSACGGTDSAAEDNSDESTEKPKPGLNETTLNDVMTKKDNDEAFYVLIYDAKQEYVKNTKLLEAYDKALKEKDMTAFYVNLNTLDDDQKQEVDAMSEAYNNRTSGHNPFEDGGMAVVHGGQFNSAYAYQGTAWTLNTIIGDANTESNTFLDDDLYSDVEKEIQYNIDYINDQEIELTY
ncbi:hypothetical protein FH966_06795 [Lentibacillus cibarius]|uniref:Uncharacterized protein n=1 Tax=Lentibacillus cibarius TaxID=2583219 RepID=A0A549YHU0_9BACI|nr:hypothetical protein [Lentibacillus cibarius]TRM11427.1 hypothetical protein FH966_06795 [Lentibacillus cibarius]